MDQFAELHRSYRLKGQSLFGKPVRASMCKRASRASGNGYFAVEFEVVSEGKYAAAISEFRRLHYSPELIRLMESKPAAENGHGN